MVVDSSPTGYLRLADNGRRATSSEVAAPQNCYRANSGQLRSGSSSVRSAALDRADSGRDGRRGDPILSEPNKAMQLRALDFGPWLTGMGDAGERETRS